MVKYFIPHDARYEIEKGISSLKSNNDWNKTIMEFDSSDMSADSQIIHSIMKLKNSVSGEVYSTDLNSKTTELLDAFKSIKDNIISFDNALEEFFIKAYVAAIEKKKQFSDCSDITEHMAINFKIQAEALKYVRKITDEDEVTIKEMEKEATEAIMKLEPVTWLKHDLANTDVKDIIIKSWFGNFNIETGITDVEITEDDLKITFSAGTYELKFDKRHYNIYPDKPYKYDGEYVWCYEVDNTLMIFQPKK